MQTAKELCRIFYYKAADFLLMEQERWGLWLPVIFACGIGLYFYLPYEPLYFVNISCFLASLALLWDNRKPAERFWVFLCLFMFSLGFFVAQTHTLMTSAPTLKVRTKTVSVSGVVDTLTSLPDDKYRLILENVKIEGYEPYATPGKIRLSLKKGTIPPDIGDYITVKALLSPPSLPLIPGGYDFARALYFDGIGGVGYAREPAVILQRDSASSFSDRLKILRRKIGQYISSSMPSETAEVAKALVTGETKAIPYAITDNYRNAGIAHILSVSGLHMSLIAGFIFAFIRFVLALFPAVALRFNTKKIAAAVALIMTFFYMLISGASLPAQRSFIMIGIALTAVLINRQALSVVSVAWAAFFVLLLQPNALVSASFQLSFAAVTALITAYEAGIDKYRRRFAGKQGILFFFTACLVGIFITDIIASIATAPFALYHFNRYAVYSLLGNLTSTFMTGFVVMPALLAGTLLIPFGWEFPAYKIASWGLLFINKSADIVGNLPLSVFLSRPMPLWGFLLTVFAGLWICLWRTKARFWSIPFFIFGLFSPIFSQTPDFLVSSSGTLMAFKQSNGQLSLAPGKSERLTRIVWLSHFAQEENSPESLKNYKEDGYHVPPVDFECRSGVCIFEKDDIKIGYTKTKKGSKTACTLKDLNLLFLASKYTDDCLVENIIPRVSLLRNGAYTASITGKRLKIISVSDITAFRPWSPSFPTLTLKQALMYPFNARQYHKIKAKIESD